MSSQKPYRWVFSLLCRWFPGRVRVRRRPVVRCTKPTLMMLEQRWSPTSLSGTSSAEFAPPPSLTQVNSDMAAALGETRKLDTGADWLPSENIALVSTSRPTDDASVVVHTPTLQASSDSSNYGKTDIKNLNMPATMPSPLSTPPKSLPTAPNNAGGGGGGAGGKSTPNAGMGGGGPTGGGGGPGLVNANQFVGVNFGAGQDQTPANNASTPAPSAQTQTNAQAQMNVPASSEQSSPSSAFQTTYSMTPPDQTPLSYQPMSLHSIHGLLGGSDPLYVLNMNNGETVPANVTLNTFSNWSENLLAQVSGATVSSYSWNVSGAPDLTSVSGTTTANLHGTWSSFTGNARTDTIRVTETPTAGSPLTLTMTFSVAGTDSPAYSSSRPTSSSTWSSVITPDQLSSEQAAQAADPYAFIGEADGSVQTAFSMPSYNPNTTPISLDYNSTTANAQPIFLAEYQLPTGSSTPSTITAQLTFDSTALATVTYNTSSLNPGDYVQIALQGNATSLSTGRYPWSIAVTNSGTTTTYSGNADIVNEASSPFGAGWSLDNVEQLVSDSGGMMLVNPDGTSLYFASNGSGGYTTPAGDFSTLTLSSGVYTRTMPDGMKINFNSSGQQTSIVDRDGNTTSFSYTSGKLTSITDMNSQVTTLTYSSGLLTGITDPDSRTATLTYTGSKLTSITDPASDVWQYGYDSANDLTSLTDPNSHVTTFTYNSADRVSSVTLANSTTEQLTAVQMNGWAAAGGSTTAVLLAVGDQSQFTDGNSNVWKDGLDWLGFGKTVLAADPLGETALTYRDTNGLDWLSADALGRRTRTFYDSKSNITEAVQADDSYSQYSHNSFSEVTQYTDPTGETITYTYNSNGDQTQKEDALLQTWTYTYNATGLVASIEDPLLNTTSYGYNALNELTSVTNALNQTVTYAYNNAGLVTSTTDALGYVSTFAYDAMNRQTGKTLPDSSTTNSVYSYTYDGVGNQTSVTDPSNQTTTYDYNTVNELVTVTNALLQTTVYSYDDDGNQITVTNPLTQTTTKTYNAANALLNVTNALNQTYTYTYNAAGEQTSMTNWLSLTTTYSYTLLGQLYSVTDPLSNVTTYGYDSVGDQTSVSQSGPGSGTLTSSMTYNARHQLVQSYDNLGNETSRTYDAAGNLTSVRDPLNHTTTYTYDAFNRLVGVTNALNNTITYTYDAAGNRTGVTNPLGQTTTYTYDRQGRVLTMEAPDTGVTTYSYDVAGNLLSLTDPDNNTTTYSYNANNEMVSMTNAMGHQSTYAYNAAGLLTSTTDADGRTITYGYDAIGERTSETWVSGSYTATYDYNAAGLLTMASDPHSTYTYTYDNSGRDTSVSNAGTSGVPTVTLSYTYDDFGDRTTLTDNLGGKISYSYDNDLRLTMLSLYTTSFHTLILDASVTFSYNGASLVTGMTQGLISSSLSYDNANQLTNIHSMYSGTTLANYTYGYNTGGELTSYQDNNSSSLTYGYDVNGELTSATGTLNGSSYSVSYSYDANGNRNMTGYTTGSGNELTSDGTYSYTYDNDGNTLTQTEISTGSVTYYTWDYRNRLTEVKVETSGGTVLNDETFTYDVNNNRISVSLNGTAQIYTVYDGVNPYMDFNGSGTLTERYLANPKSLSQFYGQVSSSGTVQWFLSDNINSIRQVVNASGSVLDSIIYDPYGAIVIQTSMTYEPRFLYTGGAYDSITGTYLDGAREDNPEDGRWLSPDPLGLQPDRNPYRYVGNNPLDNIDSSGMAPQDYIYEFHVKENGKQGNSGSTLTNGSIWFKEFAWAMPPDNTTAGVINLTMTLSFYADKGAKIEAGEYHFLLSAALEASVAKPMDGAAGSWDTWSGRPTIAIVNTRHTNPDNDSGVEMSAFKITQDSSKETIATGDIVAVAPPLGRGNPSWAKITSTIQVKSLTFENASTGHKWVTEDYT